MLTGAWTSATHLGSMLRPSLLAFLLLLTPVAAGAPSPVVEPGLRLAFDREGRAVACVTLRLPPAPAPSGQVEPGRAARLPLAARRKACSAALAAFDTALPRAGCRFLHRFQNSPTALIEITTPAA